MKLSPQYALVLAMFTLAGCGKNKMVVGAEAYEKETCACQDVACVTAASTKFATMTKENVTSMPSSGGDLEAYTKATTAAAACVTKVSMAGMPALPKK
jgi:hypothetical protein